MSWKLNVPKILHLYWGTGSLPYLRYCTITSFMKYNPDWIVKLWRPLYPAKVVTWKTKQLNYKNTWTDYTAAMLDLPIEEQLIDFEDFGLSNDTSEVIKSDFLRYWLLTEYGGVWSDMDILYFRSINCLKVNALDNKDKETFVCISPKYGHSNGFFMAAKESVFFRRMTGMADINNSEYQCAGPNSCNKYFPTIETINAISPAMDIGMEAVYPLDGNSISKIYNMGTIKFSLHSIGLHWYAGHQSAGLFLKATNGGVNNISNSILGSLLRYETEKTF